MELESALLSDLNRSWGKSLGVRARQLRPGPPVSLSWRHRDFATTIGASGTGTTAALRGRPEARPASLLAKRSTNFYEDKIFHRRA